MEYVVDDRAEHLTTGLGNHHEAAFVGAGTNLQHFFDMQERQQLLS
jgi:hypothetical protein